MIKLSRVLSGVIACIVFTSCARVYPEESFNNITNSPTASSSAAPAAPSVSKHPAPSSSPFKQAQLIWGKDDLSFAGITMLKSTKADVDEVFGAPNQLNVYDDGKNIIAIYQNDIYAQFRPLWPDTEPVLAVVRVTSPDTPIEGPRGVRLGMDVRDFLKTFPGDFSEISHDLTERHDMPTSVLFAQSQTETDGKSLIDPPFGYIVRLPNYGRAGNVHFGCPIENLPADPTESGKSDSLNLYRAWIGYQEDKSIYHMTFYFGPIYEE